MCEAVEKYIEAIHKKQDAEGKEKQDKPKTDGESSGTEKETDKAGNSIEKLKSKFKPAIAAIGAATVALKKLYKVAKEVASAFFRLQIAIGKGIVNGIKSIITGVKGLINTVKQAANDFKGKIKRLLRYTLGLRGMFTLFRKIRSAVKDAIKNLVQFDKAFGDGVTSVNASISAVKNSFTQLKNQIIAAFAPLINIVIPQFIIPLMNAVIAAVQKLAMMIAYLTGAPKWIRAKKINDDYAKSLDNVSGSAKKAANNLSSLDEIHLWQDDNGGGGGGGYEATKPEDMFEWVDTPEEMVIDPETLAKNLANKINDAISRVKWKTIGENLAGYVNKALTYVDTLVTGISWDGIGAGLATTVNNILTSTEWEKLGTFLTLKKNALTELLNGFFDRLSWEDLKKAITRTINRAIENIDIDGIAHLLSTVVIGAMDVASGVIAGTNWDTLGAKIVSGLQIIFEKASGYDWKGFGSKLAEGINKIPWKDILNALVDAGGAILGGVFDAMISLVEDIDWEKLLGAVSGALQKVMKGVTKFLKKIDWSAVGDFISDIFESLEFEDLVKAFSGMEKAVQQALEALFKTASPTLKLAFKQVAAEIDPHALLTAIGIALGVAATAAGLVLMLFNPLAGGIVLGVGALLTLTNVGIALADANASAREATSGIAKIKQELQDQLDEAMEAVTLVQEVNLKITASTEEVESDFAHVQELIDDLFNMQEDGVTVTEMKKIQDGLAEIRSLVGEEKYNELGLYFDTATLSIQSTNEEIDITRDSLHKMVDDMLEAAKQEAMMDVYKDAWRDLYKAEQEAAQIEVNIEGVAKSKRKLEGLKGDFSTLLDTQGLALAETDAYNGVVQDLYSQLDECGIHLEQTGNNYTDVMNAIEALNSVTESQEETLTGMRQSLSDYNTEITTNKELISGIETDIYRTAEAQNTENEAVKTATEEWGEQAEVLNYAGEKMDVVVDAEGRLRDSHGELIDSLVLVKDAEGNLIEVNDKMIDKYMNEDPEAFAKAIASHKKYIDSNGNVIKWDDKVRLSNGKVVTVIEAMAKTADGKYKAMSASIKDWADKNGKSVDEASKQFEGLPKAVEEQYKAMQDAAQRQGLTLEQVMGQNGEDIVKGLWIGMSDEFGSTEPEMEDMWESVGTTMMNILGIASPSKVSKEAGEYFVEGWEKGLEKLPTVTDQAMKAIKTSLDTGFSTLSSSTSGLSTMDDKVRGALNDVIDVFNSFLPKMAYVINQLIDAYNKLAEVSKKVPNPYRAMTTIDKIQVFQVSPCATGAVIPPNAPFLAMLGDQTSGTNIEAPESLIRQIVREETGGGRGGGSYQFVAQLNRRTLFEEMIEEAEMRQLRTGENPFALG